MTIDPPRSDEEKAQHSNSTEESNILEDVMVNDEEDNSWDDGEFEEEVPFVCYRIPKFFLLY